MVGCGYICSYLNIVSNTSGELVPHHVYALWKRAMRSFIYLVSSESTCVSCTVILPKVMARSVAWQIDANHLVIFPQLTFWLTKNPTSLQKSRICFGFCVSIRDTTERHISYLTWAADCIMAFEGIRLNFVNVGSKNRASTYCRSISERNVMSMLSVTKQYL